MNDLERITHSAEETRTVAAEFGHRLAADDIVLLVGDLGSGKTVFTQGLAKALGLDPGVVQSPTYTVIHEYRAGIHEYQAGIHECGADEARAESPRLIHIDLYRLSVEEVESTGVDEALAGPGVKIVEWADRLPWRPGDSWMVSIERIAAGERRIRIRRDGA